MTPTMPSVCTCALCDTALERPRFFPRQIVTADDLTLDQDYFLEKLRRHNRNLHGWGVVCGATLDYSKKEWMIVVKEGSVLAPCGDEIVICHDVCFDVRMRCVTSTPGQDPCGDIWRPPQPKPGAAASTTVFVAIEYVSVQTRPVRVKAAGCGCEDNQCEPSRSKDSYRICVLDTLPDSHKGDPVAQPVTSGVPPACPAPADCWVVLGALTLTNTGKVTQISYTNRRQVVSFAPCWWRPTDPGSNPNS